MCYYTAVFDKKQEKITNFYIIYQSKFVISQAVVNHESALRILTKLPVKREFDAFSAQKRLPKRQALSSL